MKTKLFFAALAVLAMTACGGNSAKENVADATEVETVAVEQEEACCKNDSTACCDKDAEEKACCAEEATAE
ncbi:MAG: hypothetical protein LUF85_17585 [Bacteroides sp.]|nr:hypothetical protein [Bacteroides sp.]